MSRTIRRCCLSLCLLSLGLTLSCGVSAGAGAGGAFVEFTIFGKTITLSFGAVPPISAEAGQPTEQVPVDFPDPFGGGPTETPPSGKMRLPSSSVTYGEPRSTTEKGTVRSQALPLTGSATIRFSVMPLASASCDSAILLAEYDLTLTTGVLAVRDDLYDLSPEALAIIATGNFTICVQITSDVAGEFTLGVFDFSFGGGTDTGEFLMVNADTVENIHILLPGEDFDSSNRLTPGDRRNATVSGLDIGDSVTVRAGRNSTVLDETTCPTVTGSDYQATVTWDGFSVTCTATQEGGEDDTGITPGTTIQVPIDNVSGDAVVAPVTLTEGGVDYGVVGVVEAQTPDVTATPIDISSISFDLAELGLESVHTLYMATHSAFVPDIPNGVTVATLTVAYAEGGTPTTLDLVLGSNTSEWSYERPEHATVPHDLVTTLYDFQTSIDSASEYTGRVFSVTLPVDATRTIACLSLTMSPSSTFAALRPADSPTGGWAGQAMSAITLEGTAGSAFIVGSCALTGDGLDDDDAG